MSGERREGLYIRMARMEKQLAKEEGREPEGWIWTESMDVPRHIDFDAMEEKEETPDE